MKVTGGDLPGEHNQPTVIGADPDFKRWGDDITCPECGHDFKSTSPSLSVTCPACKTTGFQFPDNVPTCPGCGTRGLCAIIDGVHWKLWVPFPPEVMQKFWEQWNESREPDKENLDVASSAERLCAHITKLSEWTNHTPKTIRYMNQEELEALRTEIFDALLAYGTTKERAEELTANLPPVCDLVPSGDEHTTDIEPRMTAAETAADSECETRMPYFDRNGDLVIPYNCPPRHRWWQGGQTIAETRAELTKHQKK